jgi:hypothetical protein
MKTINIKGKEYVPVVERVKELHKLYPNCSVSTEVVGNDGQRISVKATVTIHKQVGMNDFATLTYRGHSQAEYGKGMMGDVALEVAETSAVGRALGFANIGLIDGIASADEMKKVRTKQDSDGDEPPF